MITSTLDPVALVKSLGVVQTPEGRDHPDKKRGGILTSILIEEVTQGRMKGVRELMILMTSGRTCIGQDFRLDDGGVLLWSVAGRAQIMAGYGKRRDAERCFTLKNRRDTLYLPAGIRHFTPSVVTSNSVLVMAFAEPGTYKPGFIDPSAQATLVRVNLAEVSRGAYGISRQLYAVFNDTDKVIDRGRHWHPKWDLNTRLEVITALRGNPRLHRHSHESLFPPGVRGPCATHNMKPGESVHLGPQVFHWAELAPGEIIMDAPNFDVQEGDTLTAGFGRCHCGQIDQ